MTRLWATSQALLFRASVSLFVDPQKPAVHINHGLNLLPWWGVQRPSAAKSHRNLLIMLSGSPVDLLSQKSWGQNPGTSMPHSALADNRVHK